MGEDRERILPAREDDTREEESQEDVEAHRYVGPNRFRDKEDEESEERDRYPGGQ